MPSTLRHIDVGRIGPGEIWAVAGSSPARRSEWCARIVNDWEDAGEGAALLNFAQHAKEAQSVGWTQARYYGVDGRTVGEFLSFNSVYDVNPFEVGARHPETRRAYRERMDFIMRLLDVRRFMRHAVISLSNGEMRRVLFARALARNPKLLVLDDPAGGMDAGQRARLRDIVAALAKGGMAVIFAYRYADELPPGVTKWLKIGNDGSVARCVAANVRPCGEGRSRSRRQPFIDGEGYRIAPPVVEIGNLRMEVGGRQLFNGLSWTVRKGERWLLCGENGTGKTTLFALITGDSPFAYAADIRVFGVPRETGEELARTRRRMGLVSPEMQACLGLGPEALLDRALRARHDLLLLDEPFMNLDARDARRLARRIEAHLRANRDVTAILICHRREEAPRGFVREFNLADGQVTQ